MKPALFAVLVALLLLSVNATPAYGAMPAARATNPLPNIHTVDFGRRIDVNRVNMVVTNFGSFAYDLQTGNAGFEFPAATGKMAIFASGLWLGAKVGGEIRVAVAEYSMEYGPGIMVGGTYDDPERPAYRVYKVVRFGGNPDDTSHVDRTPEELAANPLLDPIAHHSWSEYLAGAAPYGAPVRIHRLPDTSTPAPDDSVDVLGPDVSGDMMLWAVYNDADPALHTNQAGSTSPLGVEVQQTTFAYNLPGPLGNTVFIRFKIINKGANLLEDMYTAAWSDPDVGGIADDLVGTDVPRGMGYAYNSNGADLVYGATPPAVGYDLLRGPAPGVGPPLGLTAMSKYISGTDPQNSLETYNYMLGLDANGLEVIDPTTLLSTTFWHPGDPIPGTGWVDGSPSDRRMLLSSGPFGMAPGDSQDVTVGIVAGEGVSNFDAIAQLRCADDYVAEVFAQGLAKPFPTPADCPHVVNCTRPQGFWAGQCPNGGSMLTPAQMQQIASCVNSQSGFFDWPNDLAEFCALLTKAPNDVRIQAKQEFASLLANVCAGQLGIVPTDGRPILLSPLTSISCTGLAAATVAELIVPTATAPNLFQAVYLNDNSAHRRALEGIPAGLGFFDGGAGAAIGLVGSALDPAVHPDSFATVEVRFDQTSTQKAYRYLRLERLNGGGAPPQGRAFLYGGHRTVPFTCWDVDHNEQLEVAFVERTVTDDFGSILGPEFQLATFDSTWGPDASDLGGREYLFAFRRPYSDTPRPEFQQDGLILQGTLPLLYVLWSKLRDPSDVIDDGDRFQWIWGIPESPGVDQRLFALESQPLNDPAVQQAYTEIRQCLSDINMGLGIGPTCDAVTATLISLVGASADPTQVSLVWHGGPGQSATLYRKHAEDDWAALAVLVADGSGVIRHEDRDVVSGERYGYRLGIRTEAGEELVGEVWVDVPTGASLSLAGFRPNPADGDLAVSFSLASRDRATLELFDLAGRRVRAREVGALGPGRHVVGLGGGPRLSAGIYVLRLSQGGHTVARKSVIVR